MPSIRRFHAWIEGLTLLATVGCMAALMVTIRTGGRNLQRKSLADDLHKIDISIASFVNTRVADFTAHLGLTFRDEALAVLPGFSDIYHLTPELTIRRILKKEADSVIFPGYDLARSRLGAFLKNHPCRTPTATPILRAAENERPSFYIAVADPGGFLVGRIGIDALQNDLNRMAEYTGGIVILATADGYVLSSSVQHLSFNALPAERRTEITLDGTHHMLERSRSDILGNDIVLLSPLARIDAIIDPVLVFLGIFTLFIVVSTLVKWAVQVIFIFRPIADFGGMLRKWDLDSTPADIPSRFLRYQETAALFGIFAAKSAEIRRAVERIREDEAMIDKMRLYLKNIIDSMPSLLISIDATGVIAEWNNAATRLTGIGDARGKVLWEVLPTMEKYRALCREVLQSRKEMQLGREILHLDAPHPMNVTLFPLTQNGVSEVAIRLDDISELERKENQLRQAQKMEAIGTLVGGIAHDFNNILSCIVGSLSLIRNELEENRPIPVATLMEYVSIMEDAGRRAADMVKQMLTLASRQDLSLQTVSLTFIVRQVVKICSGTFDRRVEIRPHYPEREAAISADPVQIEQVVLNLCINAMQAMTIMRPAGEQGGLLAIEIEEIHADEAFRARHDTAAAGAAYWRLSVQDTGVGMDEATIGRIFDPFFSTKAKSQGTGLGLTMVYSIVHQHHGFIDVYSEVGKGSRFVVYLPALEKPTHAEQKAEERPLPRGQATILVVDDEAQVVTLTRRMLETLGYTVLSAENGLVGLEVFRLHRGDIDLIILDINMPKMSGDETLTAIRAIDDQVPVIVASGFIRDERADTLIANGARCFLQKPFTFAKLANAVAEVLAGAGENPLNPPPGA